MFDFCQITKNSCTPERKSITRLTLIEVFHLHVRVFPRIDGEENGEASALDGNVEESVEHEHLGQNLAPCLGVHGAKSCHQLERDNDKTNWIQFTFGRMRGIARAERSLRKSWPGRAKKTIRVLFSSTLYGDVILLRSLKSG